MNCNELRRYYELEAPAKTCEHIRDALSEGHLQASDFSLRDIAEECVPGGREWVRSMDPRSGGRRTLQITEADGVDVTAFANITGQSAQNRPRQILS